MIPTNLPQREYIQGLWSFEDNFNDSSNNGYTLTETSGTIPFVSGKIGKAADFELGETEYLRIASASCPNLHITGNISISAWVKPESVGTIWQGVVARRTNSAVSYFFEVLDSGKIKFCVTPDGSTQYAIESAATLSTGNWYHLVGVYDGSKIYVYLNNTAYSTSYSSGIYDGTADFTIGAYADLSCFFDGLIDEVIVWNKALSADEVSQVYNISAYSYTKGGFGFGNPWIFLKDAYDKHKKLWTPKGLILPQDLGFSY